MYAKLWCLYSFLPLLILWRESVDGQDMSAMDLGGPPIPRLLYEGSRISTGERPSSLSYHRFSGSVPVLVNEKGALSLSLQMAEQRFGQNFALQDSGPNISSQYRKVDLGAQYTRRLDEGKSYGLRLVGGSASDELFVESRDITFSGIGFYSYPGQEKSQWVWTVFMSNNNSIINYIPIPGFVYFYRGESFTGMFGVPFAALHWTPVGFWHLSLMAFGPSARWDMAYGERRGRQFFWGAEWRQQSYLRRHRLEQKDRLYVDEKKVAAGVRGPFPYGLFYELSLGYSFGRQVYEGSRFGRRDRGHFEQEDAWLVAWSLRFGP